MKRYTALSIGPSLRTFGGVTVVVGLAISNTQCGNDCTEIGCSTAATLRLDQPLEEPGAYRISVDIGDEEEVCSAVLPMAKSPQCSANLSIFGLGREEKAEDVISESAACNIAGVSVNGHFEHIKLTIEKDEATIVSREIDLKYEETEPNGPGCGVCLQADTSVTM